MYECVLFRVQNAEGDCRTFCAEHCDLICNLIFVGHLSRLESISWVGERWMIWSDSWTMLETRRYARIYACVCVCVCVCVLIYACKVQSTPIIYWYKFNRFPCIHLLIFHSLKTSWRGLVITPCLFYFFVTGKIRFKTWECAGRHASFAKWAHSFGGDVHIVMLVPVCLHALFFWADAARWA